MTIKKGGKALYDIAAALLKQENDIFVNERNYKASNMNIRKILMVVLALTASTAVSADGIMSSDKWMSPSSQSIVYTGRVDMSNPYVPRFNWPGTEIRLGFTGTTLRMICRPMTGYFMVSIDGCRAFKVSYNSPRDSVRTLAAALKAGKHTARIMYAIEGLHRRPECHGFLIDRDAALFRPALPRHRIEFIGNSITCGFGNEDNDRNHPFADETENHYYSYATIVSDSLDALHTSISRSGIGAYRNYAGPKEGSPDNMSYRYRYTLFGDTTQLWDFSRYTPEVVCINLGTNDLSTAGYDIALYEKGYRQFLGTVRKAYPKVPIVLLTGPMLQGKENELEKQVLDRIADDCHKAGDRNILRFDFSPQTGALGYGAAYHPSLAQHRKMAAELYPVLRKLLK